MTTQPTTQTVLAVDVGAESGRVLAVHFDGQYLRLEEVHRFPNNPVWVRGTLHWDMLRLWHEAQAGIEKAVHTGKVASIAVDTWAVDFALVDRAGHLVSNPVHYRDARTDGMLEYVFARVPRAEVFRQTGIQILSINTLYQLASMVKSGDPALEHADRLIAIPDLLYYWLTGVVVNEYTLATSTQCYDTTARTWAYDLLERLNIPTRLFRPVTDPGAILGKYHDIPVVLGPHHDTACAVVGSPATSPKYAYLSSGTWSLLGLDLPAPVNNEAVLAANVTNEGGYGGRTRFLKIMLGLWLIQESRRTWQAAGQDYSYDELVRLAEQAEPFVSLIDPDDSRFLAPGDMPARIRAFCEETGQPQPQTVGAVARCIFESLALKYRYGLRQLIGLTEQPVETLHIVGGGSQNALLCQMAADASGIPVVAGPVEATALGNALCQFIALGAVASVEEGRALIRESFPLIRYTPRYPAAWDAINERFQALIR